MQQTAQKKLKQHGVIPDSLERQLENRKPSPKKVERAPESTIEAIISNFSPIPKEAFEMIRPKQQQEEAERAQEEAKKLEAVRKRIEELQSETVAAKQDIEEERLKKEQEAEEEEKQKAQEEFEEKQAQSQGDEPSSKQKRGERKRKPKKTVENKASQGKQ